MEEYSDYITIGIPFYNAEKYLELSILSVINQSHSRWELLLIDDGSTDNSLAVAKKYESLDKRIKVFSDGKNKKLASRLNQIINLAKYDYIARMDADDLIHPDRLKIQLDFLKQNSFFDLVSSGVVSIDSSNKVYGYRRVTGLYSDFSKLKQSYPSIVHASILARKSWYQRNLYNPQCHRAQDYELWCRTSSKNDLRLAVLPDLLYYYREEGELDLDTLLLNYSNGSKIYSMYSDKSSVVKATKTQFKKIIAKELNRFGLLQSLARLRNKQKPDEITLEAHQNIIDNINIEFV